MSSFLRRTGPLFLVCTLAAMFVAVFAPVFAGPLKVAAAERGLTIASYGGAYTRSQIVAYIDPFREETRQWVEVVDYNGGLDALSDQVFSLNVKWDIIDMTAADAIRACDEGLLERLDGLQLPAAPDGTPAAQDFFEGPPLPCAVAQNVWATVIAYDSEAFQGVEAPRTLADFFDLERFPGSRGLQKTARVNLEWALLSDGVAPESIYPTLETEAGVARAFAVLERIRPAIVWWSGGEDPLDLLQRRRVALSSAWSGRVFARNHLRGGAIGTIWDGNLWESEYWAIPKGAANLQTARRFIAFASEPERQAIQANQIAYSPARRSALALVEQDVLPFLPTAAQNTRYGLASDAAWWARNGAELEQAFLAWAEGPKKRNFYPDH